MWVVRREMETVIDLFLIIYSNASLGIREIVNCTDVLLISGAEVYPNCQGEGPLLFVKVSSEGHRDRTTL